MSEALNLSNCDREQIQYAGAIQPHGALLVLRETDLTILQVSANSEALLGLAPDTLLQREIGCLLGDEGVERLRARLAAQELVGGLTHLMTLCPPALGRDVHLFGNRIDGVLLLEIESVDEMARVRAHELYQEVHATIKQLQSTSSLQAFFDLAVTRIRDVTGYDRVLAYRFEHDGSGEVIAESLDADRETYLGLHYPASDIPEPARRLFRLSWLRHLPDVDYVPASLIPELNPVSGQPLDLSYSSLRSMSVMHLDYLRNMGVRGSLVITLLKEGRLWGLISCMHHDAPRYIPHETRLAVEFLAHMVSLLMGSKTAEEQYNYRLRLSGARARQFDSLVKARSLHQGLLATHSEMFTTLEADGGALFSEGRLITFGATPSEEQMRALVDWLAGRDSAVFVSHRLSADYPPAAAFSEVASGLLAVRLFHTGPDCLMWLRREVRQTVNWAGDPRKPVEVAGLEGESRLMPRSSFALWRESVSGQAHPWLDCEIEHATELRHGIIELVVRHAEQLRRINTELAKSNLELDTFAYAASHDLKEPLRGIHNFAQFLQDEEHQQLSEQGRQRLATIIRLTRRMDDLIESLLQYSRVGRIDLNLQSVDLNGVLAQVLELLQPKLQAHAVQVRVLDRLPMVQCDAVRTMAIFSNLITNAIKYNDKADKWIEIGCDARSDPPLFFVRDNGLGIAPKHFARIFQIFRRLHGRDEYGGGTGAGLTITKKAIERHGGTIWLESVPGEGSVFHFTLAPKPRPV